METVQSQEGYITMEDMTDYHVRLPEPASTLYQRYHVLTSGAEWGGAELAEKLNLMELAGIGDSTDSYLTNSTKLFWLASISRLSSFISFFAHAVPNGKHVIKEHLGIDLDKSDRRTKDAAEELWDKIGSVKNMKEINELMREMVASVEMDMEHYEHASSGVTAVDRSGNVCSLVHGTDSGVWGSGLFVQGVSLPSSGIALKSLIKGTRTGSRVPSAYQPVIIFKEEFPELRHLGRRHRRETSLTSKNRRKHADKRNGLKPRRYKVVEVPQKLVVLRTHNRARSHLEEEPFSHSSPGNKSSERKQLERLVKPSSVEENSEEEEYEEYNHVALPLGERPSTQRTEQMRDGVKTSTKVSSNRKTSIPTPMEESETLYPTQLHPLKPVPRRALSEKEQPNIYINLADNDAEEEEREEEEKEMEEKETLKKETDEREEIREGELIKEHESREFPHLGIPDPWEPDTIPEERGELVFHTGLAPVLALTCTGPSHSFAIPQYLTSILDSGMNPKAALEAPTFLASSPRSFQRDIQVEKYSIDENVLQEVGEYGQPFTEVDSKTADDVAGIGAAVTLNSGGKMLGCVHPSKGGFAEGVWVLEG